MSVKTKVTSPAGREADTPHSGSRCQTLIARGLFGLPTGEKPDRRNRPGRNHRDSHSAAEVFRLGEVVLSRLAISSSADSFDRSLWPGTRPMPEPAPVMRATFPIRCVMTGF